MDIQFVPGQRWVSNTESELGLGIVMDTANRRVTVSFPAGGERRTYAMDNAPLSRVHYTVGETISSADGISFTIAEIHEQGGYLIYAGQDCNGNSISLEEIDLESFVQFSRPQDRLFAGQIDKNSSFQLRVETLHHLRRLQQAPPMVCLDRECSYCHTSFTLLIKLHAGMRQEYCLRMRLGLARLLKPV